jgi:H+/gluconate symporter-like permease
LQLLILLLSLVLLMAVAYRGFSVILFAPPCALLAVLLSQGPTLVQPFYSNVFMHKMVGFIELYFPVFMLGAVFGKLIEMSGAARAISLAIVARLGHGHVMLSIVLACAVLTYGGVSLFVVAFAVYPLAAFLFRESHIPKRLIPGTLALGSFSFTMDALPGSPQIQNVIPTSFFGTTIYAAPILGCVGSLFVLTAGMVYLQRCRKAAVVAGEDYGIGHRNEPDTASLEQPPISFWLALLPLLVVALVNPLMGHYVEQHYGTSFGSAITGPVDITRVAAIWSIEVALCLGILTAALIGGRSLRGRLTDGLQLAVAGALLATMNSASEYGFGGVIASLPGFEMVKTGMARLFADPLINEAVSVNTLAGVTGSASGGLSLALAAMSKQYTASGINPQVLHRIASMSSGGMDLLPHNGAVITVLIITGLTHRQSYRNIFAITCIKTVAVFFVIAFYRLTGLV